MRYSKKDILLKEAVIDVNTLKVGDTLIFYSKSAKDTPLTHEIVEISGDRIKFKNTDGIVSCDKEDLKKEGQLIEFVKESDGSTFNFDLDRIETSPCINKRNLPNTSLESQNEIIYKSIDKYDFIILTIGSADGKDDNIGTITFYAESEAPSGGFLVQYNDHTGSLGYNPKNLEVFDTIVFKEENFKTYENCLLTDITLLCFKGGSSKKVVIENVSSFKMKKGKVKESVFEFYELLKKSTGGDIIKLNFGSDDKNLYFEVIKPFNDIDATLTYITSDDIGSTKNNIDDQNAFFNSKTLKISKSSFKVDTSDKSKLKLLTDSGQEVTLNNITSYGPEGRTKDEVRGIEGLGDLSEEQLMELLKNNDIFRDSVLKKPSFFAELFGAKNLGWIPIGQKFQKDKFGENYNNLKAGNIIKFKFIKEVNNPLGISTSYIGKMKNTFNFFINEGYGFKNGKYILPGDRVMSFKITITGKGDEEDTYKVDIFPTETDNSSGSPEKKPKNQYSSTIQITNYNIS